MQLEIQHPAFRTQRLAVETAGWFSGPKLLLNGSAVKKQKGRFPVASDSGEETPVQLKYNFLDPIPKVAIAGETLQVAPSFRWYEYAWIGIPMLLLFIGGAIGGGVGAMGAIANGHVFRSGYSTPARYGLSAFVTVAAFIVYGVLATAFQTLVRGS